MTIHYFSPEPWEEGYVRSKLPSESIAFHPSSLAAYPELTDTEAEALCVFVDSPVGESEMARFPALKLIATRSTGYDHIDVAAAAACGIAVATVPSYGENTVAEFTFALILALSRKIIDADERVRLTGTFSQENLRGFDLAGKTLGVVGCGRIGTHVIRMAQGFSMNVLGFDANPDESHAKELGFAYASLESLLAASDIVTLHVPYLKETHHLINASNI
ncbi:MAG TPA: NAD(P)-dependent oxidoreductase, partial [Candidatus Paceibacterota bacterium]|nr:NAD(P)-dependent oxidoreductase [Candidatus Paceibacterota bacterium]